MSEPVEGRQIYQVVRIAPGTGVRRVVRGGFQSVEEAWAWVHANRRPGRHNGLADVSRLRVEEEPRA